MEPLPSPERQGQYSHQSTGYSYPSTSASNTTSTPVQSRAAGATGITSHNDHGIQDAQMPHRSREKSTISRDESSMSSDSEVESQRIEGFETFSEDVKPARTLGVWDCTALIVNKMIGAGIWTTPGIVLGLTRNKGIALGLWGIGGVYSFISFNIYLELGLNMPYNGGDLLYLDRLFPRPVLLATILYTTFFISYATTAGNAIAFARYCLAAAAGDQAKSPDQFDERLIRLIAVAIVTVVCLLLYFRRSVSRGFNVWFMIFKIGLLLTVFIAGTVAFQHAPPGPDQVTGTSDWGHHPTPSGEVPSNLSRLAGAIYVIYSYEGWENANYVTGEIKNLDKGTLRWSGYIAVFLTTFLYVMGTLGFYLACSYSDITGNHEDLGMGYIFAPKAFGGKTTGFRVCIAVSAMGNLFAVIWTYATVKQSIALQRIIPFPTFIGEEDKSWGTPGGALFLQWLITVPFICATPNTTDGYSFVLGIYSYQHCFFLVIIGIGLLLLLLSTEKMQKPGIPQWRWKHLQSPILRLLCLILFTGGNLLILVTSAGSWSFSNTVESIPRWIWPAMISGSVLFGLIYWSALRALQYGGFLSEWLQVQATVYTWNDDEVEGVPKGWIPRSQLSRPNNVDIKSDQDYTTSSKSAQQSPAVYNVDFDAMKRKAQSNGTRNCVRWEMRKGGTADKIAILYRDASDVFDKWVWRGPRN